MLLRAGERPRVEVLNGNGRIGATRVVAEAVVRRGFRVVRTDNADRFDYATTLVIATAGAYFGEVVRRRLGGRWEIPTAEERKLDELGNNGSGNGHHAVVPFEGADWRVVLPTGLSFSPAGIVAAAIAMADLEDFDSEIDAPPRMRPYVQQALARMGEVSVEDYYSLCGRLDTLAHIHEVLVAVAAQMMGNTDDDVPETTSDEPSGPVN